MSFAKRFIGAENLPTRLSDFDVQQSFCMSADDIAAVSGRFLHDRRVAAAIQMLFLRASGRPMDRFASVPKTLLRAVCEAFQTPAVSIASLGVRLISVQEVTVHARPQSEHWRGVRSAPSRKCLSGNEFLLVLQSAVERLFVGSISAGGACFRRGL